MRLSFALRIRHYAGMSHRRLRWFAAGPLFVLATCTSPVATVAPPAPAPAIAPAVPSVSDDWRDWPSTVGEWHYRAGVATFGQAGVAAELELRCDPATRTVMLARTAGPLAAPRTIVITTADGVRSFAASDRAGAAIISFAARDSFLDRMAFSRGRIVVSGTGMSRVVAPVRAEIGRVVEDCRG